MSFPVRERGLKPMKILLDKIMQSKSFPVRERGLKQDLWALDRGVATVVPRAGTWIETGRCGHGATVIPSFPVRERGLKPGRTAVYFISGLCRSPCGNVD